MMNKKDFIQKKLPLICLVLSLSLFVVSMTGIGNTKNVPAIAKSTAGKVEARMAELDNHISSILSHDPESRNTPEGLPEDIVIYHYVNDSLVSWNNQFPLLNDDISRKMVFQRLSPLNNTIQSPLTDIPGTYQYICIGPKWYLVKSVEGNRNDKVIAGIEIKNNLIEALGDSENGINPKLKLHHSFSCHPLSYNGGVPVLVHGEPLFKISYDSSLHSPFFDNCTIQWISIMIFAAALVLFLSGHRTFRVYFTVLPILCILAYVAIIWGRGLGETHRIFSSRYFSDGTFRSIGILLICNAWIFTVTLCTFLIKGRISQYLNSDKKKARRRSITYGIVILLCIIGTLIYIHWTLTSFIRHSIVILELYKVHSNIFFTVLIYLSYTALAGGVLLLCQELRPMVWQITGKRYNLLTRQCLTLYAFLCALYFTLTSGILGFQEEKEKVEGWAEKLISDRDKPLEELLGVIEDEIASDELISSLARREYSSGVIANRIKDYYLSDYDNTYNISIFLLGAKDRMGQKIFSDIIHNGTQIAPDSRFMFVYDKYGHGKYAGLFLYYHPGTGTRQMILQLEPNANKEGRGYSNILTHFKQLQEVNIPQIYSYAKYKNGLLTTYKGTYPYPTVSDIYTEIIGEEARTATYRTEDDVHFIVRGEDDEIIVMSRPKRAVMTYFTTLSYLFLALCLLSFLYPTRRNRKLTFKSNYFRTRISMIMFISSFLLLSGMAVVSITFVYNRNEQNMFNLMKNRVNTIQSMLEKQIEPGEDWTAFASSAFSSVLEDIGNATKSDISLYTPEGKIFKSTSQEIFEKNIMGSRVDEEAFYNIRSRSRRFYVQEEETGGYSYWTLYAPLLNDRGEIIAIMSIPYTDTDYDFMKEGFFHAALIINVFILLLIISLVIGNRIINSMFSPLVEMGKKMSGGNVDNLEYITYNREDEISSLVEAYNRMVKDLSYSTKQLAQAERDKAWSQMARQVAHEIKNPLTPIKLEIQRLIRLKQNNNPKWEEKFDQVTAVVLEHIQILSDTANEFSTFAKLYTEEPVMMDLDKVIQDQLIIFDNKENVEISYIGLENAVVKAPKPQLIRVFVNLITNAIQAVEIQQKEAVERGEEPVRGRVLICLRHGSKDGFYDIAIDDNGPGVNGENLDKLFTPNFTTKSGGTGLGLAICRNIIEKCDGEIFYQKSFGLGGASFVVRIPKNSDQ